MDSIKDSKEVSAISDPAGTGGDMQEGDRKGPTRGDSASSSLDRVRGHRLQTMNEVAASAASLRGYPTGLRHGLRQLTTPLVRRRSAR